MTNNMPSYFRPIAHAIDPESDLKFWESSNELFNKEEFRKSIISIIRFLNPSILAKDRKLGETISICTYHGSANINITITASDFLIDVPFLNISNSNKVAILRRVAEVNMQNLNLSQIILKGETLHFQFETPIELCHPAKIYDLIREVCVFSDNYDDEFIEKYNANYITPPDITHLKEKQQERAWKFFQTMGEQYSKYTEIFEQKRWQGSLWDIMAITLFNLADTPYFQGTLKTNLEQALSIHYDGNLEGHYRIEKSKHFLNDLFSNTTKENFLKNIYMSKVLISLKKRSSNQILANVFDQGRNSFAENYNTGNRFAAAYTLKIFFLRVLYEYNLDGKHQDAIYDVLEKASGKDCKKAAEIYWGLYSQFLKGAVEGGPRKTNILLKILGN